MTAKNKSIIQLITICIISIAALVLALVPFPIKGTVYDYKSLAGSIKLDIGLSGGVIAVYECKLPPDDPSGDLDAYINATIRKIESLLEKEGYTEATVRRQGDMRIRIEVPDVDDPEQIFEMIGTPAQLYISSFSTLDEAKKDPNVITGKGISSVKESYQRGSDGTDSWGVSIEFKGDAKKAFEILTENAANNSTQIYMYIGDDIRPMTVDDPIRDGKTFIRSDSVQTMADAKDYALQIMSGTYNVELSVYQNSRVSATLGENALKNSLIAGGIGLALIFLFMFFMYRGLGFIANLSLIIYTFLLLLLLATVPGVQLSLPGIAGILLSIGMAVDAQIIIFERIKEEYRSGKKMSVCFNEGFRRSVPTILDSNITTILAAIVLYFVGTGAIKGFAITLLLGIVVSMAVSLVITRWLLKICLRVNSKSEKLYALKRGLKAYEQ